MKLLTATQKNNIPAARWFGASAVSPMTVASAVVLALMLVPTSCLCGQSNDVAFKNARIRMVNGSSVRANVKSIDQNGNVSGSALIEGISLDQIISIDTGRETQTLDDLPFLTLQLGGQQPFTELQVNNDVAVIKNGSAVRREFPLELVESITFAVSDTVKRAMGSRSADKDSVVVDTSSGEKIVPGLLEKIDDTYVFLNYGGKSRKIAIEKVRAVMTAKLDVERAPGTLAQAKLTDGSLFVGVIKGMSNQQLEMQLSKSQSMEFECARVSQITIQSDRVVYLSDLSPVREEQQTQFAAARPWQKDKSLLGNPIRLKFNSTNKSLTFDKGIGARSFTSLVFPNDGFDTFHAVAGIDVETGGHGDCEMVVSGDGIRLWSSRIRASEDPQMIKLDVKGIEEVTLTVFPGEKFDLADHANWADARFTKN